MPSFIDPQPARFGILGTKRANKDALLDYSKYEAVLKFITSEMNRNAKGPECKEIRNLILANPIKELGDPNSKALNLFSNLVKDGGKWDYKRKSEFRNLTQKVRLKRGGRCFFVTPIRNDRKFLYFYDIWGNIHYSFVGMACGITRAHLYGGSFTHDVKNLGGAALENIIKDISEDIKRGEGSVGGTIESIIKNSSDAIQSSFDDLNSIEIGINLADRNGDSVSASAVHSMIFQERTDYDIGVTKFKPENLTIC